MVARAESVPAAKLPIRPHRAAAILRVSFATLVLAMLALGAGAAKAWGHLGNVSYSELSVRSDSVVYRFKFAAHRIPGLGPEAEGLLTRRDVLAMRGQIENWLGDSIALEADGKPCQASIEALVGPDSNDDLEVISLYSCGQSVRSLKVSFKAFDAHVPGFENIATIHLGERTWSYVFSLGNNVVRVGDPAAVQPRRLSPGETAASAREGVEAGGSAFVRFLAFGFSHILEGYDHLAFLLALLLLGGSVARLAGIVTSFTVAHSITLSLAALGLVSLPPAAVEIAIAASIMFVAAENLLREESQHRWVVTFFFGLVHGFGFAGVLAESGLEAAGIAVPLLAFNLGVEAGQLLVVLTVVPALRILLRGRWRRSGQLTLSAAILALAFYWLLQRLAPLL